MDASRPRRDDRKALLTSSALEVVEGLASRRNWQVMKIGAFAKRIGLSVHTLRYYERIGLLPRPPRDRSRQRSYDDASLAWIVFLGRLRTTGMPIRDMLRYAQWRAQGLVTENERRDLLVRHRDRVRAEVAELQMCLSVLDTKIATYGDP